MSSFANKDSLIKLGEAKFLKGYTVVCHFDGVITEAGKTQQAQHMGV